MIDVIRRIKPKVKPNLFLILGIQSAVVVTLLILTLTSCTQQPSAWQNLAYEHTPYKKMGMIGSGGL